MPGKISLRDYIYDFEDLDDDMDDSIDLNESETSSNYSDSSSIVEAMTEEEKTSINGFVDNLMNDLKAVFSKEKTKIEKSKIDFVKWLIDRRVTDAFVEIEEERMKEEEERKDRQIEELKAEKAELENDLREARKALEEHRSVYNNS